MWLMTTIGFFSVVQKPGTDFLTVRARVGADLDRLREQYLPELGASVHGVGTDYPWRATVPHTAFAAALGQLAMAIDYPNFKHAVEAAQGPGRAKAYHQVWGALYDLKDEAAKRPAGKKPGKVYHPRLDDKGQPMLIRTPTPPGSQAAWADPSAIATCVPGGPAPAELNGVAFTPWTEAPVSTAGWAAVPGQMADLEESPLVTGGKAPAAGVVVVEPDGRVWLVCPTNQFGGYQATYPKGRQEPGLSLQATAIKEAYEESGLKVKITGLVGDFPGTLTMTRYYTARRAGGTPADMGWESQAVKLVPWARLGEVLNAERDQQIAGALAPP